MNTSEHVKKTLGSVHLVFSFKNTPVLSRFAFAEWLVFVFSSSCSKPPWPEMFKVVSRHQASGASRYSLYVECIGVCCNKYQKPFLGWCQLLRTPRCFFFEPMESLICLPSAMLLIWSRHPEVGRRTNFPIPSYEDEMEKDCNCLKPVRQLFLLDVLALALWLEPPSKMNLVGLHGVMGLSHRIAHKMPTVLSNYPVCP